MDNRANVNLVIHSYTQDGYCGNNFYNSNSSYYFPMVALAALSVCDMNNTDSEVAYSYIAAHLLASNFSFNKENMDNRFPMGNDWLYGTIMSPIAESDCIDDMYKHEQGADIPILTISLPEKGNYEKGDIFFFDKQKGEIIARFRLGYDNPNNSVCEAITFLFNYVKDTVMEGDIPFGMDNDNPTVRDFQKFLFSQTESTTKWALDSMKEEY